MHGVKRSENVGNEPITSEELQKIEVYKLLLSQFTQLHDEKDKTTVDWAERVMDCTKEILTRNPEYYTAWNERKRALKLLDPISLMKSELMINVLAIKANPKSYSAWYHRRWFLENYCPREGIIEGELKLLEQLLDLDCRNFHGWNYRIWLTGWAELSVIDEFDFTTLKIYQNFSNYSAWQRRAHLLPKYLDESGVDVDYFLRNEVELCRNAAWTEPSDQSIWFYQRWFFSELPKLIPNHEALLISLARDQIKSIEELIEEEGRGSSVALAMSFVVFIAENALELKGDAKIQMYLDQLKVVDPLRIGHYTNIVINSNKQA